MTLDVLGQADAAGAGNGAAEFFRLQRAPGCGAFAVAERIVFADACEHFFQHVVEEDGLEFAGDGLDLVEAERLRGL
jgi:hypothetical protein